MATPNSGNPAIITLRRKQYSAFETQLKAIAGHWPEGGRDVIMGQKRTFSHLPGVNQVLPKFIPSDALIAQTHK